MGEQRALLTADTAPELQNHIPPVVGVPGQQQDFQLLLKALPLSPGGGQLLLRQLPHFGVPEKDFRLLPAALRFPKGPPSLRHRRQLLQLPLKGLQAGTVAVDGGVRQLGLQTLLTKGQLL